MPRPLRIPALLLRFAMIGCIGGAWPCISAMAQEGGRVRILNADELGFDNHRLPGAQVLRGNVRLAHGGAEMRCDSAHLYDGQRLDAFGRVEIVQGDSLRAGGRFLRYDARDRIARMEGDVRLRDRDMELVTPALVYDLRERRATYISGGRITHRDGSVLTSGTGTYLAGTRHFIFGRNVRLEHPERTIACDTMHYGVATGVAEFFGPTEIRQEGTLVRTLRGTYDTRNERARFTRRSSILSKGRTLEGDSLHYDRRAGTGVAWGNVMASDTTGDMTVHGEHAHYHETRDSSMVTGRAELVLRMGDDTLFLHADTLFTSPDGTGRGMRVLARRGARFFKSDLQGACDTLMYSEADSVVRMFHRPVLWSGGDQITGERISIVLRDGKPRSMHVPREAFLLSGVDSTRFDQVAGTSMTGHFDDGELRRIRAEGNCRTVYFARETKDGREEMIGVNRADCSLMEVLISGGAVRTITFMDQPDAVLYPMGKVPPEELRMEGAVWRGDERPAERAGIFERP